MSAISRRTMIARGLAAAAGLSGLAVAERIADRYGLVPPDHGGIYGPGTPAFDRLSHSNRSVKASPRNARGQST